MLIYLRNALAEHGRDIGRSEIAESVRDGTLQGVRPKAMTVAVILAGLLPILLGTGAGSDVMSRIAAPMIGGMITAPLLSIFVLPAAFLLLRRKTASGFPQCAP
jgi:Cu(I)/Ag(I) efflux system membrane protein CusA/SilA